MWSQSPIRYRQTDWRTDGQTTYHGNTALRYASRGKNRGGSIFKIFSSPQSFSLSVIHGIKQQIMTCMSLKHFRSDFWSLKLHQISNFPGHCLGPRWVSLQRSPDSLSGSPPHPQEPYCRSRTSGLELRPSFMHPPPCEWAINPPAKNKFGLTPLKKELSQLWGGSTAGKTFLS